MTSAVSAGANGRTTTMKTRMAAGQSTKITVTACGTAPKMPTTMKKPTPTQS
jgi:hypothetical protein